MAFRYSFKDVNVPDLPRIKLHRRTFGDRTYTYLCEGRASTGHGYTPEHAYAQWKKNWTRRYGFYKRQSEWTRPLRLAAVPKWSTPKEPRHITCNRCGSAEVHWRMTADGWRLYDDEREHPGNRYVQHNCRQPNPDGFEDEPAA